MVLDNNLGNIMEEITEHNLIGLMQERFPKFVAHWEVYVSEFGLDKGLEDHMRVFVVYVVNEIKSENHDQIEIIFEFVETLMVNGHQRVLDVTAIEILEVLLGKDPEEIQFVNFSRHLGKRSKAYLRAWEAFQGTRTEGLYDD